MLPPGYVATWRIARVLQSRWHIMVAAEVPGDGVSPFGMSVPACREGVPLATQMPCHTILPVRGPVVVRWVYSETSRVSTRHPDHWSSHRVAIVAGTACAAI